MQQFKYIAIDLKKKKFTGIFIAEDEKDLALELSKQGLYLISAKPYTDATPSAFFSLGNGKIKHSELTTFCRQFSIMINAGVSLVGCIEILKEQSFSTFFKKILQIIYDDVKSGIMLSDAFKKHKTVFPDFFRNMIKVGESSGKLDVVFNSLAEYYEKDSAIVKKTKSAFAYPTFLLIMTFAIITLLLMYIVPTFKNSLEQMGVEPEGLTLTIIKISDFMKANWLYLFLGVACFILFVLLFSRTKKGKRVLDYIKIHIPGFKKVTINLISARFARGFGLLLSSGMDLTDALKAIQVVIGNYYVEEKFKCAVEDIEHGMNLAIAFDKYKIFPQIMIQMIAVGEKTASLDETLTRSSSFFDDEVETSLNSIVSKIQPTLLLILGGIIGVLFLAVYSPILSIVQKLV